MANGNDNGAFGFARRMMASAGLQPEDVPEPSLNLMRSRDRLESALEEGAEPGERFMMFQPRSEDPSDFRSERSERLAGMVQDLARARTDRLEAQAEQQEQAAEQATNMLVANLAPQLAQSFTGVDLGAAERSAQQQQRARQAQQRAQQAQTEAEAQEDIMELEADLKAGRIEAEDQAQAEERARENREFNFQQLQTAASQYNQMAQNAETARQKRRFQELSMASDIALAQMKADSEDKQGLLGEDEKEAVAEFGGLVTSGVRALSDLFPADKIKEQGMFEFNMWGEGDVPQSTLRTLQSSNTKNRFRKLADDLNRAMGKMESKGLNSLVDQQKWQAAQSLHNSLRRIAAGAGSTSETDAAARQTLMNAQGGYREAIEAGVPTESRILGRVSQIRNAMTGGGAGNDGGGEDTGDGESESQVSPESFDQF